MEHTFDGLIDTIDVSLQASADEISRQLAAGKVNQEAITNYLIRQQQRLPNVSFIRATNERGDVIYGPDVLSPPHNNSDRNFFIRLRNDPAAGLYIINPFIARIDKKWIWLFVRRINKIDGTFGGMIYAAIFLDQIENLLPKLTLHRGDSATIRDSQLGLIARYVFQGNTNILPGDNKISAPFLDALESNPIEGTYISGGTSIDSVSRSQSYRRSEKYGYYVNVGISREAALDVWRKQAWVVAGLLTCFILVTLGFARSISRTWQRQKLDMEALREAQEIASIGHFSFNIISSNWTSSKILDGIFGLNSNFPHDGRHWIELIAPDFRHEIQTYLKTVIEQKLNLDREFRIIRQSDGQERWVHGKGKLNYNPQGKPVALIGTIQDITGRKQAEEEISNLAFYDTLTLLPNRRLMMDRLRLALTVSARSQHYGAVLFLDMDKFKMLNDTMGHDYGDLLLVEVAARIQSCIREGDTVARLGGDEFLVLLEEVDENSEIASQKTAHIADKIRIALSAPYILKGKEQHSSSSIGVSLFRGHEESVETLLKHADMAMYQSKDSGRNVVRFFDPTMQLAVETHSSLEADLRRAIYAKQLQLYYQIQVDEAHAPTGAEALLRWMHPKYGMIPPAQFIPIAEDSSLILDIGGWVLNMACQQLSEWAKSDSTSNLTVAVNVSAKQFNQQDFVTIISTALNKYQFNASRLKLELTESVVMNDIADVVKKMHTLKALGVGLSMDDFGTGYSSLSYLKQLPLDQIKIDQSFIQDIATDTNDAMMVQTIIDMAKNFQMNVIAEGVETQHQLVYLKQHGCMAFQGYLFSQPISIEQFEASLDQSCVLQII